MAGDDKRNFIATNDTNDSSGSCEGELRCIYEKFSNSDTTRLTSDCRRDDFRYDSMTNFFRTAVPAKYPKQARRLCSGPRDHNFKTGTQNLGMKRKSRITFITAEGHEHFWPQASPASHSAFQHSSKKTSPSKFCQDFFEEHKKIPFQNRREHKVPVLSQSSCSANQKMQTKQHRQFQFQPRNCSKSKHNFISLSQKPFQREKDHRCRPKKKYKCRFCPKEFNFPSNRSAHHQIHTRAWRYKCPLCDRGYTRRDRLIRHLKKKHTMLSSA